MVPGEAEVCPNCNVGRSGSMKKVLVAVSIAVSSLSACMPYGVPPCPDGGGGCYSTCEQPRPDGGLPRNEPGNPCFTDGGSP